MNKKLQQKIKKLNILKDKMRDLKNEIDNLSQEIQSERIKNLTYFQKPFLPKMTPIKKQNLKPKSSH